MIYSLDSIQNGNENDNEYKDLINSTFFICKFYFNKQQSLQK